MFKTSMKTRCLPTLLITGLFISIPAAAEPAGSPKLSAVSYQLAPAATQRPKAAEGVVAPEMLYHVAAAMALIKAFRTHGHLAARIDPLGAIRSET